MKSCSFRAVALVLLGAAPLAACSSFKPPEIDYDDLPLPAALQSDPPQPIKIVDIPKALAAARTAQTARARQGGARRADRPEGPHRTGQRRRPRAADAATATSTPSRSIPSRMARSIRSTPRPAKSPTSRCRTASNSSAPAPSPPATPCAGSSATPKAARDAAKKIHILVKPTRADLMTNLVINTDRRTYHLELRSLRRPTWPRSPGNIRRTSSSRCAARTSPPRRRRPIDDRRRSRQISIPLCDRRRRCALAPDAGLRRRPQGLYRIPARHRPGRNAAALCHRRRRRRPSSSITACAAITMIVDRLFAAAELRFGGDSQKVVRIVRSDGRPAI